MGLCVSTDGCILSKYARVTGVEASHVCAKFSQTYFEVCILEPLLNPHFINHHLRMPDLCVRAEPTPLRWLPLWFGEGEGTSKIG